MRDLTVCGFYLNADGIEEPICCNPRTGDLILVTDLSGNLLIGNVSVNNPIDMRNVDVTSLRKLGGYIGVAVTQEYLLGFKEDFTIDYRLKTKVKEVFQSDVYDLDADYEGEVDIDLDFE